MSRVLPVQFTSSLAAAIFGGILLLGVGMPSYGSGGLWTFHHLLYLPVWLRALGAGVLIVTAILFDYTGFPVRPHRGIRLPVQIPHRIPILLFTSGMLFWSFREKTFSGDGLLKIALLSEADIRSEPPYIWKEPLNGLLEYAVSRWLPPETAIGGLSVLAGMIFILAAIRIAGLLARTPLQYWVYLIALFAGGSAQLWFGHIENYSLVTALAYSSLAFTLLYVSSKSRQKSLDSCDQSKTARISVVVCTPNRTRRRSLWPAGFLLGAAVSFHPQASFALPAFLPFLTGRERLRRIRTLLLSGLIVPIATILVMIWLQVPSPLGNGGFAGDSQLFLSFSQALAFPQLADVLMNLWLVVPGAPILVLAGLFGLTQSNLRADQAFQVLTGLAGGFTVYLFLFQNDLPRMRDWDLFAIVGPGIALWGTYALVSFVESATIRRPLHLAAAGILPVVMVFSIFFAATLVGVNHSFRILAPDPAWRHLYERYRLVDLLDGVDEAQVTPTDPICTNPAEDPTGCKRVTRTVFTMPQTGDSRPVLFAHAPVDIRMKIDIPTRDSFLWTSPAIDPISWGWGGDGVTFQVAVVLNGREHLLWEQHYTPQAAADLGWHDQFVRMSAFAGESVDLILRTHPGPLGDAAGDRAGWGTPWLMDGTVQKH